MQPIAIARLVGVIAGQTVRMGMVGQDLDDAALGNPAVAALADHAAQLAAQGLEAGDFRLDIGKHVARYAVDLLARLIRLVDEFQQLADGVEGKAELACVADEGEPIGVRL